MRTRTVLTHADACRILAAGRNEARRRGWGVTIAVVDEGGHLIVLERLHGAHLASVDVAIEKARCSVLYRRPTKVFEDLVKSERPELLGVSSIVPVEGGLPIVDQKGEMLGGVGVSGVHSSEDSVVATVAVCALTQAGNKHEAVT